MQKQLARCAVALGMLCAAWVPSLAFAEEHALILWIGQYAAPHIRIVGLERDAALARDMALALGVSPANMVERSNAQLTHTGLKDAMAELRRRVRPGDGVFIYFSGHGRQVQRVSGGGGCSEGLATFEGGIYFDLLLQGELDALAQRASRVVMFNDSCFSGGAATKSYQLGDSERPVAKTYPQPVLKGLTEVATTDNATSNVQCGVHANPVSKALGGLAQGKHQHGVLYVAAAAANEAAYPTPEGSLATRAWAACLQTPSSPIGKPSVLTGAGLQTCANSWIQRNSRLRQTITLVGNGQLPLRRF